MAQWVRGITTNLLVMCLNPAGDLKEKKFQKISKHIF